MKNNPKKTVSSLLVELRCEELPPQLLFRLAHEFGADLCDGLQAAKLLDNDIDYAKAKQEYANAYASKDYCADSIKRWGFVTYPTCRRLAVFVHDVRAEAPVSEQVRRGPAVSIAYADGKPSKALLGFLRANNASEKDLTEIEDRDKAYVALVSKTSATPLDALVGKVIEDTIKKTVAPRMMCWGDNDWRFVRPIRNICVVHGKHPVTANVFDMKTHGLTAGHRFMKPKEFDLSANGGADGYVATMRKNKVLVDPWERWARIKRQVRKTEKDDSVKVQLPAFADDDNVAMTEWPAARIVGLSGDSFDLSAIPHKINKACVEKHLRSYSVISADKDRPLTKLVFVADEEFGSEARASKHVNGLERVYRARLNDARFLYEKDKERGLKGLRRALDDVFYLTRVTGNMSDRNKRLEYFAGKFASMLAQGEKAKVEQELAKQAAHWCQIDLASGTLDEYPQLAGYVISNLLRDCNESNEAVWDLLANWKNDPIEKGNPALHGLVLADELDRLVIFAATNRLPSGSGDPHGLRSSATRVLSVLANYDNRNLSEFIKLVEDKVRATVERWDFEGEPKRFEDLKEEMNKLVEFILGRLVHVMHASGDDDLDTVTPRMCQAVTAGLEYEDDIDVHAIFEKAAALASLEKKHDEALRRAMALHKRLYNITAKNYSAPTVEVRRADITWKIVFEPVKESELKLPAEKKLFTAIKKMEIGNDRKQIVVTFEKNFLKLIPLVESFFDEVRLDVDDKVLADNRAALVNMARDKFDSVADFRRLYS